MSNPIPAELAPVLEAIIEAAPALLASRMLLPAMDWSKVPAADVARLLGRLDAAGKKAPSWLLSALVAAGHHVDETRLAALPLPERLLNRLNDPAGTDADWLQTTARDVASRPVDHAELAIGLVRRLKAAGHGRDALQLALGNWQRFPQLLRPVQGELKEASTGLTPVKLRLLGFSTTHPFADDLVPAFAREGFRAEIVEANFGEVMPELMRPVESDADAYILMLDLEGFHAHDWRLDPAAGRERLDARIDMLVSALTHFVETSSRAIFVNTLPLAPTPALGFIDRHHADGTAAAIRHVNHRLAELASRQRQVILIDSFVAMSGLAPASWSDPKLWFWGRIPYAPDASRALAGGFARAWRADKKGPLKVLAIDLDNTMWGGIYGEDGTNGLQVGDDHPGNAFKAMQHEFLRLKNQGMLLTIFSKNNPDAISVFADHPGMVLKADDFVAHRIDWNPKPENIRELAKELNVGLDSFIFLDDSPHEREAMRALCPEVYVPELPDDPAQRPSWLRSLSVTWPIRITAEDAARSSMYLADRKAKELKASAASFEDYLAGLEQKLVIEAVSETTLPRIAQMHIRTNQFNLTTRRYDEADIKAMMEDPAGHLVVLGSAADKFGDHGIVIAATVAIDGRDAELKTLLMSCRVIGRQIETAFLGALLARLQKRGVERVRGAYIPTAKNVIVIDFYKDHGFAPIARNGEETVWGWEAAGHRLPASGFVTATWR
jgi:FkbH-like protein